MTGRQSLNRIANSNRSNSTMMNRVGTGTGRAPSSLFRKTQTIDRQSSIDTNGMMEKQNKRNIEEELFRELFVDNFKKTLLGENVKIPSLNTYLKPQDAKINSVL